MMEPVKHGDFVAFLEGKVVQWYRVDPVVELRAPCRAAQRKAMRSQQLWSGGGVGRVNLMARLMRRSARCQGWISKLRPGL